MGRPRRAWRRGFARELDVPPSRAAHRVHCGLIRYGSKRGSARNRQPRFCMDLPANVSIEPLGLNSSSCCRVQARKRGQSLNCVLASPPSASLVRLHDGRGTEGAAVVTACGALRASADRACHRNMLRCRVATVAESLACRVVLSQAGVASRVGGDGPLPIRALSCAVTRQRGVSGTIGRHPAL